MEETYRYFRDPPDATVPCTFEPRAGAANPRAGRAAVRGGRARLRTASWKEAPPCSGSVSMAGAAKG